MALATTRNTASIKRWSDALGGIMLCSSSGSAITSWLPFSYMAGIELGRVEDTSELVDGSGSIVATDTILKNFTFKAEALQTDKATMDMFDESFGYYIAFWFRRGLINGKNQEVVHAPAKIIGTHTMGLGDWSKIPITIQTQKNDAAVTYTSPAATLNWTVTGWATSATIAATKQRIVVETTAA